MIDPDWQALPAELPAAIRVLLRRCLEKDRRRRVADIGVAIFALDEAADLAHPAQSPAEAGHYEVRRELPR